MGGHRLRHTHGGETSAVSRRPLSAQVYMLVSGATTSVCVTEMNTGVNYAGNLRSFARGAGGAMVRSYSAKTSMPIVEDFGTAQLNVGAASVALDPTFASSIDSHAGYRVFLTPNGDTHGLYIAAKSPAGFVVRETGGGHGTLSFDYRIVATAAGQSGQHMAVINPATLPHAKMPAAPQPLKLDKPVAVPVQP